MKLTIPKVILLLCMLVLLSYGHTVGFPFIHDAFYLILENPDIGHWQNIPSLFFPMPVPAQDSTANVFYRPFQELTYKTEYLLFGESPFGYQSRFTTQNHRNIFAG